MNRQSFPFPWANGGEVTDPDLDTEHPSFVANRYQGLGWKSEKFPSEWQNFLSNLSDNKIIELISQGLFEHRENISYPENAVVSKNNTIYQNVSGKIQLGVFDEEAWSSYMSAKSSAYQDSVKALSQKYVSHANTVNAHKDTVDTIIGGSYVAEYIDESISSATNPKTIAYHIEQKGRIHNETPQQVGTLPDTGGKFTGAVGFLKGLTAQGARAVLDEKSNTLVMNFGKYSIGIDAGGNAFWDESGTAYLLLSEANYNIIEMRVNRMFILPMPYISMNIKTTLNDVSAIGDWLIEYSGTPTFGNDGFVVGSTDLKFHKFSAPSGTLCVYGVIGGVKKTICVNVTTPAFGNILQVINLVGQFTEVASIIIYPTLNEYQKTMLVNSESK